MATQTVPKLNGVTAQTAQYLHGEGFSRLWRSTREAFERNGGLGGQAVVRGLAEGEAAALNGLLRRRKPLRAGVDAQIPLSALDAALREFACPLGDWLIEIGGPLVSRPQQREHAAQADAALWAELEESATTADARLRTVVSDWRSTGLLKRLGARSELTLGRQGIVVLARLLARETELIDIAVLAAALCGDAKALNDGRSLATIVIRGLGLLSEQPTPANAASRRALWERFGVVCDPLSSHVLCLNLPVFSDSPLGVTITANAEVGEPVRLTLRQLRLFPLRFEPGATIYVCENPTVVSAAAELHGERCAPIVCTDGRPVLAVTLLLEQAAAQGCRLRYHGDFDWPGLMMAAETIRRFGAEPWQLGAGDYQLALAAGTSAKTLKGRAGETAWDPELAAAMASAGVMVEEEAVIASLLADLG